jgi:acetyl esterase/lipase
VQPREGLPVAKKFMSFGYSSAILRYSIHPNCYPMHYNQGLKAIKLLSSRFKKIILIGFSAGGHLSGLLGTTEREKLFNAVGMILCYPVISFVNKVHKGSRDNFFGNKNKNDEKNRKLFSIENRVSPNTLPTFIWTCRPDTTVPYENSLFMIKKLKENKVFHVSKIFKTGRHGIVLAEKNKEVSKWVKLACNFIDEIAKK